MTKKRKQQLSRVKSFIRRAEKRGYVFDDDFKQSIGNKTTRALQFLTPRKLYEKATYTIGTVQVSGLRGRALERQRAAIKGVLTRKRKSKKEITPPTIEYIVYQNVMDLINLYPTSESAEYLKNLFKSEIKRYGLDKVVAGMLAIKEDFVKRAHEIVFYEGDSMRIHDALVTFSELIRAGVRMTEDESKELSKVSDTL